LAEIDVMKPDGSSRQKLTPDNNEEERATAWSPDGTRIVYSCRIGGGTHVFQICVMNADGTGVEQLTADASVPNLTATWSPDGQQLVFNKILPPLPPTFAGEVMNYQLFTLNPTLKPNGDLPDAQEITCAPAQNTAGYPYPCPPGVTPTAGINIFADWGVVRVKS
jgi:Tol biopolymer transport system component